MVVYVYLSNQMNPAGPIKKFFCALLTPNFNPSGDTIALPFGRSNSESSSHSIT